MLKDYGEPFNNLGLYRSMVEALQYLVYTRTNIASLVHQVYQFMQSHMAFHFLAMKRILRYLKGTITFTIKYTKSDAANSVSIVFLRDNPILWAYKQKTVSQSSTKAEYIALSITASEIHSI